MLVFFLSLECHLFGIPEKSPHPPTFANYNDDTHLQARYSSIEPRIAGFYGYKGCTPVFNGIPHG